MGKLADFFRFGKNKKKSDLPEDEKGNLISNDAVFVTAEENDEYADSIMGQLLNQGPELKFIFRYLPETGKNLMDQAESIKKLLLVTNNEQDVDVIKAFNEYMIVFRKEYKRAEGMSTIEQLDKINFNMNALFSKSTENSDLSEEKLYTYIGAIKALQEKVDDADKSSNPILQGPIRYVFNDKSLESEYRLKMLELLYVISVNPWKVSYGEISNPFQKMSKAQRKKFPVLFSDDLDKLAKDYEFLSYSEELLDKYGSHKFKDIDEFADDLNIKIGTEKIKDFTYRKMFDEGASSEEFFENIKKMVYIRYHLNEMVREIPTALKRKEEEIEEQKEKQRKDAENRRKKAEAEEQRKKKEAEEKRIASEKAEQEAITLKDASDEEIQAKIDELNHDVTRTGSRYINIVDFQKRVAKLKGLLPTDEVIESDELCSKVFNGSEIMSFIKQANESGVNYMIFPDSQEGADGGFNAVVSKTDESILDIQKSESYFKDKNHTYRNGARLIYWKKYGTIPGFYLKKLQELFDKLEDEEKDECSEFTYVDEIKKKRREDIFEIGMMMHPSGRTSRVADRVMTQLLTRTNQELEKEWKDKHEDKDVMCYLSIPATQNIIPVLRLFKEKEVTPYFERVGSQDERNTQNRDNIHIYFHRDDLDKFWFDVRPRLINVPDEERIPYEIHYGKGYDFRKENSYGLNLKLSHNEEENQKM